MEETDANDNSKELHNYSKEVMKEFCKTKVLTRLKALTYTPLLTEYHRLTNNLKIFTHAINKLFNYLNRFYLKNHNAKMIPDESMNTFV